MAEMKFKAILPKTLQAGDEIVIKGVIDDGASDISINFPTSRSSDPPDIVYQLRFSYGDVLQNSRMNGDWCTGERVDDGGVNIFNPDDTNQFCITFFFNNSNEILIYMGDQERNLQFEFQNEQTIDTIDNVQIWNDLAKVQEIVFRYAS